MGDSTIRFKDVSVYFRHRTGDLVVGLNELSVEIVPGQFVCIVGRSGHGKSTLLRSLAGLEIPTMGEIIVGDRAVSGPGNDRGMVFQPDTVFPWMKVRENVAYGLRARGVDKEERQKQAQQWLEAVGLRGFEDSWPRELSGGMRKRVAFAAVLAAGSDIWLMDEPFASLDYFTRRNLHELVLQVWGQEKKTVLFVTHDIEEALILADRILLLSEGRLVDDMIVQLPRPRDEETRASDEAVILTKTIFEHLGIRDGETLTTNGESEAV